MTSTLRRSLLIGASALLASAALTAPVAAGPATKTSGDGTRVNVSWTEYDPDDLIGAPGNVHVGYLYAEDGPYGTYFFGNVTDFDCAPGQTPFFGHGHVVDEGAELAGDAAVDAIEEVVESGGGAIDADVIVDAIGAEITAEIPELILEESFGCTYMGDRFLEGDENMVMEVNKRNQTATITGNLVVSTGGHGEPGNVLGRPPVAITITGGVEQTWEYSYSVKGPDFRWSDSQKGTDWNGGAVTGAIGSMNFADDADDESFGSFGSYSFRTVERVR